MSILIFFSNSLQSCFKKCLMYNRQGIFFKKSTIILEKYWSLLCLDEFYDLECDDSAFCCNVWILNVLQRPCIKGLQEVGPNGSQEIGGKLIFSLCFLAAMRLVALLYPSLPDMMLCLVKHPKAMDPVRHALKFLKLTDRAKLSSL